MEDTQPSDISPQTSKRMAAARMLQRGGCRTRGATHEPLDGLPGSDPAKKQTTKTNSKMRGAIAAAVLKTIHPMWSKEKRRRRGAVVWRGGPAF